MKFNNSKEIKCVVWDLDNTVWDGVLLEDEAVVLKPRIKEIVKELDARGILNSIASKNEHHHAMNKLKEHGLDEYFLFPEINWNAKSSSISQIQKNLNIGVDTFLFIDDQQFELEEVAFAHESINTMDAAHYEQLLSHPQLTPRYITEDSAQRRSMYQAEIARKQEEAEYKGAEEKFLASLNMKFFVTEASENDLKRAEELTVRTNQLNSTGVTYDYDELYSYMVSDDHLLLVCELTDRLGSYGKIGLALIDKHDDYWHLKMLLMSCRVISRGVGTLLLTHIVNEAKKADKKLRADFKQTDRNKMMYITYKFNNFEELENNGGNIVFENDLSYVPAYPSFIEIEVNH